MNSTTSPDALRKFRGSELSPALRLRRRVLWVGVALIALIAGADAYEGWQDHRVAVARSQQTIGLLSRAFADQTARMVQELDFALSDFADWQRQNGDTAAPAQIVRDQLQSHIARLPYVHSVAVFGPDGHRRATTGESPPSHGTIAALPIFTVPEYAPQDALYIGTPWVSRRDGYRTFGASRRLRAADGSFAGVIVVRVAFEYLARFYAAVDVSPGAEIRLVRTDGVDLARYPTDSRTAEGGNAPPAPVGAALPQSDDRIVSRQNVAGYPLFVEVSQPRVSALAPWREQELGSAARTLLLAVLASLLLIALATALRRREEAESARRATEARLQDARKAEALSLLAASVAHDFNNVLSAIVGYAELARGACDPASLVQSNLERLLSAAERARQLVRRVLTFDPRRSLKYESVPLAPVVREVLDQLQATLPRNISLQPSLPDLPMTVNGDATEIHQVIMNLCTNAMQAMPQGGVLAVQLSATTIDTARELAVGRVEPGEWISLAVSDQGVGIAAGQLAGIFDPLQTTKEAGQGTGIGLTVVRNIISNMRGAVDVESLPGSGTRFTVYWRRRRPADGVETAADGAGAGSPARGQSLLIVDDEPQLVALVEELAASLGYEPIGYSDPLRALEAVRRDPARFDAVVTDERMPGLRGTALAAAIRRLRADLPVILVTGYRGAELDREAKRCGIVDILDKPLRLNELQRALAEVL